MNQVEIFKMLLAFLEAWLKWASNPKDNPFGFDNRSGLCLNHNIIWRRKGCTGLTDEEFNRNVDQLQQLMQRDFPKRSLTPFNTSVSYYAEATRGITHMNPDRIAWVKKIIHELRPPFKRGDVISPMEPCFPSWENMTIISYCMVTQTATVRFQDGRVFEDFNLNPNKGVEFECVNQS